MKKIQVPKVFKHSKKKVGQPPGSLMYTGKYREEPVSISVFDYDDHDFEEKIIEDRRDILSYRDKKSTTWIIIDGVQDIALVEMICKHYNIHPLTIEDILHPEQRPKIEDSEEYIFIVLKMMNYDEKNGYVHSEQVSIILGENFVLSFQEVLGDTFEGVRNRLRSGKGSIRKNGADYLMYALIDTVIDNYFVVLEKAGDMLADIEDELLVEPSQETLNKLYSLKREMLSIRRMVWPLREVIYKLERDDLKLIKKATRIYLRDVYDHIIRVIDSVETTRDLLGGMLDLYQSIMGNRMNAVMKVLTIISTIFIPLTFIAGIYGMNFEYMPELQWRYGYPAAWGVMILMVLVMFIFFKKKRWL